MKKRIIRRVERAIGRIAKHSGVRVELELADGARVDARAVFLAGAVVDGARVASLGEKGSLLFALDEWARVTRLVGGERAVEGTAFFVDGVEWAPDYGAAILPRESEGLVELKIARVLRERD